MNQERRQEVLVWGLGIYAALSLISMATMSMGAGVLLVALLIHTGGPKPLVVRLASSIRDVKTFGLLTLAFVMACVLSLICAKIWPLQIGPHVESVHFFKFAAKLWYFAWVFVLWFALKCCSPKDRQRVLEVWLLTFVVLAVIGVIQFFTGWPRPQPIPDGSGHFHATLFLGHHLSVASILIFPFFALLDFPSHTTAWKVLRVVGLTLGCATLFFTFSRTLWVALPFGILVWILLRFQWRERIALIALILVGAGAAYQVPQIRARLQHSMGIHEREDLWEANWFLFKSRPLTGVGLRQNEDLSGYYLMEKYHSTDVFQGHAHNNILDVLSTTGVIGLVAFLVWWISIFWMLAKNVKSNQFGRAFFAAFVVYQLNGLTQVNFWEAKVQHQLMWAVAWVLLWQSSKISRSKRSAE